MRMGRLEFATPRLAWGGAARAFTPLLGDDDMLELDGRRVARWPERDFHIARSDQSDGSRLAAWLSDCFSAAMDEA